MSADTVSADNDLRQAMIVELAALEIELEGYIYILGGRNAARTADKVIALLERWKADEPESPA